MASVSSTLARYGLHDNPINRESYTRAREIGQRFGMPAHDFDATLLFSLDSGSSEEAARDNRHWRRLSEARRLGIPRSWVPGDYQKPVYNQFSLGRLAYVVGLAEGAGQRVPIYTVTYEARVAGLVQQVPAFARAVLEDHLVPGTFWYKITLKIHTFTQAAQFNESFLRFLTQSRR